MLWTYDPLVARNAHLNIVRLGARPVEYVRDLYGSDTTSSLHAGLGTDRFVVEWRLADGGPAAADPDLWSSAIVLNVDDDGEPLPSPLGAEGGRRVRVEIPLDIDELVPKREATRRRWREATRAALEWGLAEGYRVLGFDCSTPARRCWYLLARGPR